MRLVKQLKKKMAVFLAVGLLLSDIPVPAFADEARAPTNAEASYTTDGFIVSVPKEITLDANTETEYEVLVAADFCKVDNVSVVPDNTVTMMQDSKGDKELPITQDVSTWDKDNISESGNGVIDGSVLSAGKWNGFFNFTISHEQHFHTKVKGGSLVKEATDTTNEVRYYKCSECGMDLEETYEVEKIDGIIFLNKNKESSCKNTTQYYEVAEHSGGIELSVDNTDIADVTVEENLIKVVPKKIGTVNITVSSKETKTHKRASTVVVSEFYDCKTKEEGDTLRAPATCIDKATYFYRCAECKTDFEDYYEKGDFGPHIVVTGDRVDSCTECSFCGKVLDSEHDFEIPTYTEYVKDGKEVCMAFIECTVCSYAEKEEVEKTYEVTKKPTCTEKGAGIATATFKNPRFTTQTFNYEIPATGHTVVNGGTENVCKKCSVCGETITSAHTYGNASYSWNGTTCTAKRTCTECGYIQKESVTGVYSIVKDATCTASGTGKYTATFDNAAFAIQTKTTVISAKGHTSINGKTESVCKKCSVCNAIISSTHNYGVPNYTWDNTTCTARRTCTECGYIHSEKANGVYSVIKEPTCVVDGTGAYTSTFTNSAFATQTKTTVIKAEGHTVIDGKTEDACKKCSICGEITNGTHTFGDISYSWNDSACTAKRTCSECGYIQSEELTALREITKAATCTETGTAKLTADFVNPSFATQTKIENISANGHSATGGGTENICKKCSVCSTVMSSEHTFGTPTYTWNETVCTAKRACTYCGYTESENAVGVYSVVTNPSCTAKGTGKYTATFTNSAFAVQTKNVDINATGHTVINGSTASICQKCSVCGTTTKSSHSYGSPSYTWSGTTCTAKRTCSTCSYSQSETKAGTYSVVTNATCTANGTGKYTATFTNSAFATQSKTTTINALGHSYTGNRGAGSTNGASGYTVTNKCSRCGYIASYSAAFDYRGGVQTFVAPTSGTYSIDVYGAQGGSSANASGGAGGRSYGNIYLNAGTALYVQIGSCPGRSNAGGYNGGGWGNQSGNNYSVNNYCGGGGGCTSITTTNRGTLNQYSWCTGEVVIVAGGGGGAGEYRSGYEINPGGAGGGSNGSRGSGPGGGYGGTQDHGGYGDSGHDGSFGQGGNANDLVDSEFTRYYAGGGGGGWYGGEGGDFWAATPHSGAGGGGGSGRINSSYISNGNTYNGARNGNGYASITLIR